MMLRLLLSGGGSIRVTCCKKDANRVHDEVLQALDENAVWVCSGVIASVFDNPVDWIDMKKVVAVQVCATMEEK